MKLIGITLRNYKCYQGTTFVRLSDGDSNFHGIIGENGVGKSAILEGLRTFFTRGYWTRNKNSGKGEAECGVGLIVQIDKTKIKGLKVHMKLLGEFSNKIQKSLSLEPTDVLLLGVMIQQNGGISVNFGESITESPIAEEIYNFIVSEINYIYLEAEIDIDTTAGINSETVTLIKGASITKEIGEILSKPRNEGISIIDEINTQVIDYFDETIVRKLKDIDQLYDYKNLTPGAKSTLDKNKLSELAIQVIFKNRGLVKKRGKKEIALEDMSSGQRRSALLDFLIAVVSSLPESSQKKLIIGIDEPEISVDAGSRIEQFQKLQALSSGLNCVLFTTHWYGWIQQLSKGGITFISEGEEREHRYYDLDDGIGRDIKSPFQLRMIFDFITSLGEWAESKNDKKFIVVEGPTDRTYIYKHFGEEEFKVLISRGQTLLNLIKTFQGFSWRGDVAPSNLRVLIDTDVGKVDEIKSVMQWACARRIARADQNGNATIVKNNECLVNRAAIEDLLSPHPFLNSLKKCADMLMVESDVEFIKGLEIRYPDQTGIWAFGLDQVALTRFYSLFKKEFKEEVANNFDPTNDEKEIFKSLLQLF